MLSVSGLADAMKSATYGATEAVPALNDLGTAITNYLLSNAELDFSWNGKSNGDTDPVTSAHGGIVTLNITLTPSYATVSSTALSYLASEIETDVKIGEFNITDAGFSTTPQPMSDCPTLTISPSGHYDRNAAFLDVADQIIDWITSYTPAGIILGSHGSYTAPPGAGGQAIAPFY